MYPDKCLDSKLFRPVLGVEETACFPGLCVALRHMSACWEGGGSGYVLGSWTP